MNQMNQSSKLKEKLKEKKRKEKRKAKKLSAKSGTAKRRRKTDVN